ncbi:MAG: ribonucleoside-triphosphate reductase, adenosylcobalamin-dependent, partial [Cyanobacteria bacterium P01_H01_bin.105]
MVQELERLRTKTPFPESAPAAYPVFYRTYSRRLEGGQRESWYDVCDRTLGGLVELGQLTADEKALVQRMQRQLKALPSGRWLWVGGTEWSKQQKNFSGAYNCTSTNVVDWRAFGLMMDLAMMGCGTGAVLEPKYIDQLPVIRNRLTVTMTGDVGITPAAQRREETEVTIDGNHVEIRVGDSRNGWVMSYQKILELSSQESFAGDVEIVVDLSDVRPAGETLKGFGGMANPVKLPGLYGRCAAILNAANGRKLNSVECCLLIDEAAACVVAGNIRRSAGMRQFDSSDELAATAKDNLWQQDDDGNWRIDPERDALRMANHTRVFHTKPSLVDMTNAVRKQFYSGEGAIQWAGEAERRAQGEGRYGLNPCGEILGQNFHCNLAEIHLNQIDPKNLKEQEDAFRAGAIAVAALLNHQFIEPRYQQSRLEDPIVGVSFTGLFDFFVRAFGVDWLTWWEAGR